MNQNHLGLNEYEVSPEMQEEINRLKDAQAHVKSDPFDMEQAARKHEENVAAVAKYRWEGQDELARVRQGRIMSNGEFLAKLRQIRPDAFFNPYSVRGLVGVNFVVKEDGQSKIKTGGTVQLGMMHEYSTMYFDAHGLPTREKFRGWRTTLLQFIQNGYITEEQANRVFGEATGSESGLYLKKLWELRNHKEYKEQMHD